MTTSSRERPIGSLPVERAFVLQLEGDADLAAGRLGGRVEHVVSGRATRFRSLVQLLAFLGSATASPREEAPAPAVPSAWTKRRERARGLDERALPARTARKDKRRQ
jgi:hypothetical protein